MKYYGKFCVVCGRRIPELSLRRRICSNFCRARYKCGYAPYLNYKELPYDDLTALLQEAQKEGLSYGKYMAMKYKKESERICKR